MENNPQNELKPFEASLMEKGAILQWTNFIRWIDRLITTMAQIFGHL
jgi:hypothetical protein